MRQIEVRGFKILLDNEDYGKMSYYRWRIVKEVWTNYAMTSLNNTTIRMHQLIMPNLDKSLVIDHIDSNGLNNQRENLRIITQAQNCQRKRVSFTSASGYKGVSYDKTRGKYYAYIQSKGVSINLGRFKNIHDAARAYNDAAETLFGEFAKLNQIEDDS